MPARESRRWRLNAGRGLTPPAERGRWFAASLLWWPTVFLLLAGGVVNLGGAAAAKVSLRDGRVLEGEVQFDSNGALTVRPAGATASVSVATNQLNRLVFAAVAPRAPESIELRAGQGTAPWQMGNLGKSTATAVLGVDREQWSLGSATRDARWSLDDFHLLHHPLVGDGELVVHVTRCGDAAEYARAGIGFFESLADRSRQVRLTFSQKKGGGLSVGSVAGKTLRTRHTSKLLIAPVWLKLERRGNEFVASKSADGQTWEVVETVTQTMPRNLVAAFLVSMNKAKTENLVRFDHLRLTQRATEDAVFPQVTLSSGSVLAGAIESLDGTRLGLRFAGAARSLPLAHVRGIAFDTVRPDLERRLRAGRAGVLLANGDFVDGEVRSLAAGRVRVESVLFGLRDYVFPGEALAVTLGKTIAGAGEFTVRLRDGSRLQARSWRVSGQQLLVEESVAGNLTVALETVAEIFRTEAAEGAR